MINLPEGAPKLEELLVDTGKMPWREKSLKGISEKMLWRDDATGASIAMIRFAKGAGIPQPHYHASNQFHDLSVGQIRIHRDRCDADGRQLLLQSQGQRAWPRSRA